jgi:hypothetical protein
MREKHTSVLTPKQRIALLNRADGAGMLQSRSSTFAQRASSLEVLYTTNGTVHLRRLTVCDLLQLIYREATNDFDNSTWCKPPCTIMSYTLNKGVAEPPFRVQ